MEVKAFGGNFGSGAHLVNQALGPMSSGAYSYFGANYTVSTGGKRDSLNTTHEFGIKVVGPSVTGNIYDDAGSFGRWETANDSPATHIMSRPTYDSLNAYASMATSIAGDNAICWLSGDDSRFHMEAFYSPKPIISDPTYKLVPDNDMIFIDGTKAPRETRRNMAYARSDEFIRESAGGTFQPANP